MPVYHHPPPTPKHQINFYLAVNNLRGVRPVLVLVAVEEVVSGLVVVEVEVDLVVCRSPSCQIQTHTNKMKRNPNPAVKETKMTFLCFRRRSENEGGVSLGSMMEYYQSICFRVLTENKNHMFNMYKLLYYQLSNLIRSY